MRRFQKESTGRKGCSRARARRDKLLREPWHNCARAVRRQAVVATPWPEGQHTSRLALGWRFGLGSRRFRYGRRAVQHLLRGHCTVGRALQTAISSADLKLAGARGADVSMVA